MRIAGMVVATLFGLGAVVLTGSDARSGTWIGSLEAGASPARLVVKTGEKKEQKALNKSCPAGKVFVESVGCVKREKAEKAEKKAEKNAKPKMENGKETNPQTGPKDPGPGMKADGPIIQ